MPAQQADGYFEFGYTEALIVTAILQKAAADGDLTRDGLLKAFNSLTDVDLGQLYPDVHYGSTPNQRVPFATTSCTRLTTPLLVASRRSATTSSGPRLPRPTSSLTRRAGE